MKKILSVLIASLLIVSCAAAKPKKNADDKVTEVKKETVEEKKPEPKETLKTENRFYDDDSVKIVSLKRAGKKIVANTGKIIEFDSNGIADIKDENYVANLIELDGFELVDGEKIPEKAPEVKETEVTLDEETTEVEEVEEAPELSEEFLVDKNVPQLRKIAKDNGIDLAGASKKDEIIAVIIGAVNK